MSRALSQTWYDKHCAESAQKLPTKWMLSVTKQINARFYTSFPFGVHNRDVVSVWCERSPLYGTGFQDTNLIRAVKGLIQTQTRREWRAMPDESRMLHGLRGLKWCLLDRTCTLGGRHSCCMPPDSPSCKLRNSKTNIHTDSAPQPTANILSVREERWREGEILVDRGHPGRGDKTLASPRRATATPYTASKQTDVTRALETVL